MPEIVRPSSSCRPPFCEFNFCYRLGSTSPPTRTQWKEEIEEKTNDVFKIHVHHGKDKLKKLSTMKDKDVSPFYQFWDRLLTLEQVIITSYGTVCSEYQIGREVEEEDEDNWLAKHG